MYCAWCGAPVTRVSYAPCQRCGRPTNGAQTAAPVSGGGGGSTAAIVIALVVGGLVVVAIIGILAAIAIPNLLTAMQRSKQKRTMADLRTVATSVEAYAADNNGYPQATSIEALVPLIEPKYIKTVPRIDGWGHPLMYSCYQQQEGRCTGYLLGSGGKDMTFEHSEPHEYIDAPAGATTNFNCDLIYADGKFIEYPEGVQH